MDLNILIFWNQRSLAFMKNSHGSFNLNLSGVEFYG